MAEERKKSSVGLWVIALLIVLPALYVASFGPLCWWMGPKLRTGWRPTTAEWIGLTFYAPCSRVACYGPPIVADPLLKYASEQSTAVMPIGWRQLIVTASPDWRKSIVVYPR